MRPLIVVVFLATLGYAQSLVENAAAAAGGSVGGVAGKKVGEGINGIFNKVDKAAAKAAKASVSNSSSSSDAVIEVGPGVPSGKASVPPPPPVHRESPRKVARTPVPVPSPAPITLAAPVPPPPAEVTAADLKNIATGMGRDQLLQLGPPAARIMMFEDGHLLEIYRYMAKDTTIGVVRLVDGSVANVQMP